eukprot:SAG11_NODE_42443_length_180_cov_33.666667_1_plen_20_part_10
MRWLAEQEVEVCLPVRPQEA